MAALSDYVDGLPQGGFDFTVHEVTRLPAGDWVARAHEHFERCIQLEIAERRHSDVQIQELWRDIARMQLSTLQSNASQIYDVNFEQPVSVDIGPEYIDQRVLLRAHPTDPSPAKSAWNSVLFLPKERVQALAVTRQDGAGAERTEVTAQRTRREVQDVELLDSSRWLHRSRAFARECIQSLRATPEHWACHLADGEYLAVWRIDQPGLWPNLFFYQGLVSGRVELRVSESQGAPLSFRCSDSAGNLVEERIWGDYFGDRHVLPLSVDIKTWYPGSRELRSSETYRGRVRDLRPAREVDALLPAGTQVTDARFAPPVTYVVVDRPLDDSEVVARSSAAAAAGGGGRTDVHVPATSDESITDTASAAPPGESTQRGASWSTLRVVGGALVLLGVVWAGLRWRAARSAMP